MVLAKSLNNVEKIMRNFHTKISLPWCNVPFVTPKKKFFRIGWFKSVNEWLSRVPFLNFLFLNSYCLISESRRNFWIYLLTAGSSNIGFSSEVDLKSWLWYDVIWDIYSNKIVLLAYSSKLSPKIGLDSIVHFKEDFLKSQYLFGKPDRRKL